MSKVGIFGAGWVGLVTGSCFAELGHEVVIRDVVPEKIEALRDGRVPFHEQDVPALLERNAERLTYTLDVDDVADCEFLFVCVDTPPTYSGDADLSRVWTVIDELPELSGHPVLVMKSTVPVGTGEKVRAGRDRRPVHHVLRAGLGYVGCCFPKESPALKQLESNSGYHLQLLAAVIEVNELQKRRVIGKLKRHLGPLRGRTIALLGLAFKANTDDMREAPSIVLASRLLAEGAEVRAWDPVADGEKLPKGVDVVDSVADAVRGADAAVIVTEWDELKGLASQEVRESMANPLIVDGRNL